MIERGAGPVAGIEVKAGATVTSADFRGLRKLASATGERFAAGVVLYDGEISASFSDRLRAVPIRRLWEPPSGRRPAGCRAHADLIRLCVVARGEPQPETRPVELEVLQQEVVDSRGGIRADDSIICWGFNGLGQADAPKPPPAHQGRVQARSRYRGL